MAEKRMLIRTETTSQFNGTASEQEALVEDTKEMLAGSGINGFLVVGKGDTWLEWEGEESDVVDAVNAYLDDERVGSETIFENVEYDTPNSDTWHGHCQAEAYA